MYEAEINGEPVDDTYFHPGGQTTASACNTRPTL
ncbi:MAG: hypothetical protein ACLUGI_00555 [Subdoligranulum sp.]